MHEKYITRAKTRRWNLNEKRKVSKNSNIIKLPRSVKTRKPTNLMWRSTNNRSGTANERIHGSILESFIVVSSPQVRAVYRNMQSNARHRATASRSLGIKDARNDAASVRRWHRSWRGCGNRFDWLQTFCFVHFSTHLSSFAAMKKHSYGHR